MVEEDLAGNKLFKIRMVIVIICKVYYIYSLLISGLPRSLKILESPVIGEKISGTGKPSKFGHGP